jgi:RNA-directed DNA polymerase
MEVSFRQLYQASRQCRRGKSKGQQCQLYEADLLTHLLDTQAALQSYQWQALPMRRFIAKNGSKPREIHAPAYADRVVQHWFVPQLQALIEPKFIYDCAANIKGKGTHFAVNRVQGMMRQAGHHSYYLQLDIHNYFYSIHRPTLLALLAKHLQRSLRDKKTTRHQARYLYWLSRVLLQPTQVSGAASALSAALPPHKQLHKVAPNYGLPIGSLCSQFFSNVYLNELDQFIKHQLKCRHYIRYVDDFVLIHPDPIQLQVWQGQIEGFLQQHLKLRLKAQQILRPVVQGVDFLGYIVRPHYRLVRRRVVGNWHSKLKQWQWAAMQPAGAPTKKTPRATAGEVYYLPPEQLAQLQSLCASYLGHVQHASYVTLLRKLLAQHSWLAYFFAMHNQRLLPRWQNKLLTRFAAQCQWFVAQYPVLQVWLQKGHSFVNARAPNKSYPLSQLSPLLQGLRKQLISYAWVAENGYVHHRLKHRQLAQLFIPGVDS